MTSPLRLFADHARGSRWMGVPTPGENQSGAEDVYRERPPLLGRPPPPVGVALPMLADVLCFSRLGRVSPAGRSSGWGHSDSDVLALPRCPALTGAVDAQLPSVIVYRACLQPRSRPGSTPRCELFPKSCSNHTPRFCPSPSSSSLPHSGWVGLKAGTNLTAASHF